MIRWNAVCAAVLFWCASSMPAADNRAPKVEAKPSEAPAMSAVQITPDDLQNLVACARMKLGDLTADQIAAVAVAIKHAEEDMAAMRKAAASLPPPPAEAKK